jgi:DNA-binding NarL/FixJ family response regulator
MRPAHSPKRKIRILVADHEGVFRLGLRKLFGVEDDLRVVAEAETARQALTLAKTFKPSLLFAQAQLLAEGAGDLLAELRRVAPASKVVVTASAPAESEALRYVQAGASGVIGRSVDPALFVKCARKVMDNEVWLPKRQVAQMAKLLEGGSEHTLRPAETLTRRQKTIISHLMQGWRNREIAQHLSISEQTVKNHLRMIYDKVGVSDRLELVLYAIHKRLELPPVQPAEGGS